MDRFSGSNEAHLLDSDVGFEVLDAIVQANVDLSRMSPDELSRMVRQFSAPRHRKAVARLVQARQRSGTDNPVASSTQ